MNKDNKGLPEGVRQDDDMLGTDQLSSLEAALRRQNEKHRARIEDGESETEIIDAGNAYKKKEDLKDILTAERAARVGKEEEYQKMLNDMNYTKEDNSAGEKVQEIIEPKMVESGVPITIDEDFENMDSGLGLVINREEFSEVVEDRAVLGNKEAMEDKCKDNIDRYMEERDEEINAIKKAEEISKTEVLSDEEMEELDDYAVMNDMSKSEFDKKVNETVVLIDKTNVGVVIDFTDEEREKLRSAKQITLKEVEVKELETIKIKKKNNKKPVESLIRTVIHQHAVMVPLLSSGYTVKLKGCSVFELLALLNIKEGENPTVSMKEKWSIIHSKIVETSLGDLSFTEFMDKTAYSDLPMLLYGLTCASFPDEDTVDLKCNNCDKSFKHTYLMNSTLRFEMLPDSSKERFKEVIDNSYVKQDSEEYAANALVNSVKRFRLPSSGILVDFEYKSGDKFISKVIKDIQTDGLDEMDITILGITAVIQRLLLPDLEANDGSYFEINEPLEMVEVIRQLDFTDRRIVVKQSESMIMDTEIKFGLIDVTCPHCGHVTNVIKIDKIEDILFLLCEREMNTVAK